jgi:ABC-type Fe3+ transport system substrate-binding protein
LVPIRVDGKTIAIPNTVSIVRGTQHEANARRFVDFILSSGADMALAESGSRQAPVHAELRNMIMPEGVDQIYRWSRQSASLHGLLQSRDECLAWLMKEFAP